MRPFLFTFSLAALTTTGMLQPARACTPPPPGVSSTRPASGGPLAANAAVLLYGYALSTTDGTAQVNGMPAALEALEIPGLFYAKAVRVVPAPNAGDLVRIQGTFCDNPDSCPAQDLQFTVVAADNRVPPSPTLQVNVYDHADNTVSIGSCVPDSAVSYWAHVSGTTETGAGTALFHTVEFAKDPLFSDVTQRVTVQALEADTTHTVRLQQAPPGVLTEAFCFRAYAINTAGTRSAETPVTCRPCHLRRDPEQDGGMDTFGPAEPEWTDADLVSDGPCAGSSGGSSSSSASSAGSSAESSSTGGGSSVAAADAGVTDVQVGAPVCGCDASGAGAAAPWVAWCALAGAWLSAVKKGRRTRR